MNLNRFASKLERGDTIKVAGVYSNDFKGSGNSFAKSDAAELLGIIESNQERLQRYLHDAELHDAKKMGEVPVCWQS